MLKLLKLRMSSSSKNAISSLLAFTSSTICGLISIPLAVTYLSKEEIGLWSLTSVIVSYLLWLDLGIGNAVGRKIAAAVTAEDTEEINRWWTLSVSTLGVLGVLMFLLSLALSVFLPQLFGIQTSHGQTASQLFMGVATVSALGMPIRVYPGMLLAQDRFHWVSIGQTVSSWVQISLFFILLHSGYGVQSYLLAYVASQFAGWSVFVWQVHSCERRIRMDLSGLQWEKQKIS